MYHTQAIDLISSILGPQDYSFDDCRLQANPTSRFFQDIRDARQRKEKDSMLFNHEIFYNAVC